MTKYKWKVRALFRNDLVGAHGYIFAILEDGRVCPVSSVEKWNLGPQDSLREGWTDNWKEFNRVKTFYQDVSVEDRWEGGRWAGSHLFTKGFVPKPLHPLYNLLVLEARRTKNCKHCGVPLKAGAWSGNECQDCAAV